MDLMSILRNLVESGDEKGVHNMMSRLQHMRIGKSTWPTIQDVSGNGLLQISALKGYVKMVEVLLLNDFDINGVDSNHGTALQAAIYMDQIKITELLLSDQKINIDTQGGYYGCALQVAAYKASGTLLKRLLGLGADRNVCGGKYGTVLQAAARTGLPEIVDLILGDKPEDVDVNYNSGAYGTALQAAAKGSYTRATKYLRHLSRGRVLRQPTDVLRAASDASPEQYLSVAKKLIGLRAKVNSSGKTLQSPVNAAAASGRYGMLELLVDKDESALAEHKDCYSHALISSITQKFVPTSRLKMVKLLIRKGADANFCKGSGLYNKPLTAAAAVGEEEVVKYLLALPGDKKAQIDSESGIYGTALRAALSAKSTETAKILIEEQADLKKGDESFGNVLHLAAFSRMDGIVTILLDHGMDVNIPDDCGQTALHVATYRGFSSTVSILLDRGAKSELEDAWGQTPLNIVDSVMERGSHPGPRLEYLQEIKRALLIALLKTKQSSSSFFPGPPISQTVSPNRLEQVIAQQMAKKFGTAKPVFSSPIWSPGLSFQATIVDFLEKDSCEYLHSQTLSIDDLLYRKEAIEETMAPSDDFKGIKPSLRWIHLPANNVSGITIKL
jgi:ankyrin repeat protein